MERVFSVEEIPSPYWAPPQPQAPATGAVAAPGGGGGAGGAGGGGAAGAMNRCPSEWYFQKFLEEAVLDSPRPGVGVGRGLGGVEAAESKPPVGAQGAASSAVVDPVEYNAMLKQKLEKDLAAVAMWMASGPMPPEHSSAGSSLTNMDVSHAGPLNSIGGNGIPAVQTKIAGGSRGGSGPQLVQNPDVLVKQATSSSSREQSDDDDMEGEAETTGNANPVQQRLQRRKQSNRESARRSRSRKAAHLNELEAQVAQLRVENSSLLRRLADVNQKFNDAAVDNRVLKADVETLRAKVKMAEDSVKRVTGMNALFPVVSDMSSLSMPFNGSPSDSTSDAAVPIQDDPNSYFATPSEVGADNSYMPEIDSSPQEDDDFINATVAAGKMGRAASLQRVASLEHLQKRMCGGPASSGSTS
ncbi:bZIP transcription factor RISBZ2-like [Phragmites australis]|uniref:bZIP transcription factor RISBZ2-like n=1 Tax=Phragmites australis TaxID=29695 RepID=UPI002D79F05B|nr:bZIP transcription factor RISBZ2-like [Phragmites australis]